MRHSLALLVLSFASGSCCPAPKPAVTPTPTPDPVADTRPEPQPEPKPEPQPEAKPEPPAHPFLARCRDGIAASKKAIDEILAVKGERTAANTLALFNDAYIEAVNVLNPAGTYMEVHPDAAVREAAEVCDREGRAWLTDLGLNRPLFDALSAVDATKLDANGKRFLEKNLRDFRRGGVDKDDKTRKRLKELADEAVLIGQEFDKNIREDVRFVLLDPAQLKGLPEDYIKAHPVDANGKVKITTDYPDYLPFRAYADDPAARKALFLEFQSRGYPKNETLLRKLLANRQEQATLLGYKNWAAYQLEVQMAKDPETVQAFIDQVHKATQKRAKADYAELLAAKKKDDPKATTVEEWERVYYSEKVKKQKYAFDAQAVRPYFDFTQTRDGLLAITAKLYDIEYKPVSDVEKWHESVDVYDVYRQGEKLGRIYLDLHPRENKFKHAAQFTIVTGVKGRQLPEGALVCNFPDPRASQGPALMDHGDVETMFHEFGHLMHHIFGGHQEWAYFSGVATEWDFVESPSMMFQEWAWDQKTLNLFAKHHETKKPIPAKLVTAMNKARRFAIGVDAQRQLQLAKMSLDYHTADPRTVDPDAIEQNAQKQYTLFAPVPGTHMWASFGHLNGYAASYYTYKWSEVIARDLLSPFLKSGLLDEKTARKYRDAILVPGGTRDAAVLVQEFLGRPYSFDAYRIWMEGP